MVFRFGLILFCKTFEQVFFEKERKLYKVSKKGYEEFIEVKKLIKIELQYIH